jgi:nitrate reductase gamma subunit
MQLHRAITLVVMMLLAVGLLVMMTASAIGSFDNHSLIALGVVVIAAAAGGIAFSWNRYFRRVPRTDR